MICYIPPNCRHVDIKPKQIKAKNNEQPVILTPVYQQQLEKLFITNIDVFSNLSHDYYSWIKIGRALYSANCSVSTFHLFSRKDKKYNEEITNKKWESFERCEKKVSF